MEGGVRGVLYYQYDLASAVLEGEGGEGGREGG